MAAPRQSVYEATTKMFIERIEERIASGNFQAPWKMTWDPALGMPRNFTTDKPYRGSNVFMTMAQGFTSPFWMTRKQLTAIGGTIKRDDAGKQLPYTPITYWIFPDKADAKNKQKAPSCRFYQVWNVEQIDGIADLVAERNASAKTERNDPITECEAIVNGYKGPEIVHGGGRACYSPSDDRISMPEMQAFESAEAYYHTLMHEITHSTGHRTRLARDGVVNPVRFASHDYSEEELIAEMGAAMLAGFAGIRSEESEANSAAYLQGWLKELRAEPKLLEVSGRGAQKAVDRIRGTEWKKAEA